MMKSPTERLYDGLQDAYRTFNERLFDGGLPPVLITLQRKGNSFGFYRANGFQNKGGADNALPELALNPTHFQRDDKRTLSTLLHEMVHHWQYCHGKPSSGHHNREWADLMESLGLMPSSTGEPGGKRTGSRMTHYIIEGGPFDQLADEILAAGFAIDWAALDVGAAKAKDPSKIKHTCPSCGLNAWGKKGIKIICEACGVLLEDAEAKDKSAEPVIPPQPITEPKPPMLAELTKPKRKPKKSKPDDDYKRWLRGQLNVLGIHPSEWKGTDEQRAKLALEHILNIRTFLDEDLWAPIEQIEAAYEVLKSGQEMPARSNESTVISFAAWRQAQTDPD